MPSTVRGLLGPLGLSPAPAVRWGSTLRETGPGVYLVCLTKDADSLDDCRPTCPISMAVVEAWFQACPGLRVDGERASLEALGPRVASFWLGDEVVLYIGHAGTSLRVRVGQYYRTELGARGPHSGGHFLKTLTCIDNLYVHPVLTDDPVVVERALLMAFSCGVSASSRLALHDGANRLPFANLEFPEKHRKRHGISSSRSLGRRRL